MAKLWHARRLGFLNNFIRALSGAPAAGSGNVIDNSDDDVLDASGNTIVIN